jgi:hypothetical protein
LVNEDKPPEYLVVVVPKVVPPAPTTTVYPVFGVTVTLFLYAVAPPPPPPPPGPLPPPLAPPLPPAPTHTTHILVTSAGDVQVYVPGVVYCACPATESLDPSKVRPSGNVIFSSIIGIKLCPYIVYLYKIHSQQKSTPKSA